MESLQTTAGTGRGQKRQTKKPDKGAVKDKTVRKLGGWRVTQTLLFS